MSRYAYGNTYGKTHGLSKTPLYKIWSNMKSRCYCKSATRYERYGGRGITVCDEWRKDFMAFYNWAYSSGYETGLSIERININLGYSPSNCKWILKSEQSKNTCRTNLVTYDGKTQCVEDLCKELGLKSNTILERARALNGDFHKALFEYKPYLKNEKRFCPYGHEYTVENSGYTSQGYRYCKTCIAERREQYNKNRREKRKCQKKS